VIKETSFVKVRTVEHRLVAAANINTTLYGTVEVGKIEAENAEPVRILAGKCQIPIPRPVIIVPYAQCEP
jgi:hypothetical protein